MVKSKRTVIFFTVFVVLFSAAAAIAQSEEGHESYTFFGDWLPRLINFGILAGVLVFFTRKPFRDFFKSRTVDIQKSIEESKRAREQAIRALNELEQKIKETEAEAQKLVSEATARAEKDKQALIDEGKKVVADIQAQVKESVEVETQKAKTVLAVEAALLSIDLAEGRIKEKINSQDHERIVKEYISKVGGKG